MNKQQFDKLESQLIERGYHKYNQHWNNEDYVLGKSFHRDDNRWDENRAGLQILLSIYDYSIHQELHDRMTKDEREYVGIEIKFDVSRTIDERIEFSIPWNDDTCIEKLERLAGSFYQWVCMEYPEPRNY